MISARAPGPGTAELGRVPRRGAARSALHTRALLLFVVLFVAGLAPRLLGLGGAVTEDEDQWIDRSGTFARALADGEWRRTYLTGHPGVTVMWLTTLALGPARTAALGEAARPPAPPSGPTPASGRVPVTAMPDFLAALHLARVPFAALNAALAALAGVLAWRLLGFGPGLLAGLLLALDPYSAGVGPIVGMDGPLTGLLGASLLSLLLAGRALAARCALDRAALGWTALAGALWGLAFLTKTTALFVVPLAPALLLVARVAPMLGRRAARRPEGEREGLGESARRVIGPVSLLAIVWGAVGTLAVVLFWPAAWGQPLATVWRAVDFSIRLGGTPHGPGNFFLGWPLDDPGPMFYPVALGLRLGPATTLGLLALLLVGAPRRMRFAVWSLLAYVVLFLVLLTVASKKVDRYLLPVLPALDILAGVGWWEGARRLAALRMTPRHLLRGDVPGADPQTMPAAHPPARAPGDGATQTGRVSGRPASPGGALLVAVAVGIAALQAWPLLTVGRYPLAAYNPLFGGARVAELMIPVGWGDGLDVAADRIRELSGGPPVTTAIWYPLRVNFQAHAPGPVLTERRVADADVYVDYVHARQRGLTPRQLAGRRPDAVVRIAGVDYARIYRLP